MIQKGPKDVPLSVPARASPTIQLGETKRGADQRSNTNASPSKMSRISLSFIPESKSLHASNFKSPRDYLGAYVQKNILSEVEPEKGAKRAGNFDSFGSEIFSQM